MNLPIPLLQRLCFKMEEHPEARFIIETLSKQGFIAYYAGGWVRDFLLQHPSDDIDIATSALPEMVQALFPHTVPIGISFGIILVIVNGRSYEVATFREDFDYQDGRRPARIEFSRAEEDAKRRDFTINGMFYDPLKGEVIDYVRGREDLALGIIRAIGDPQERIKEDRLRMMRAIRLACRFGFQIEEKTREAILAHAEELFPAVAIERIGHELMKGYAFGKLPEMLLMLHEFRLLGAIFPSVASLSFHEVQQALQPLALYPKEAPFVAFLWPLFPVPPLELVDFLKLSNQDRQFCLFWLASEPLLRGKGETEDVEWAHFYANGFSQVVIAIFAAYIAEEQMRCDFLLQHRTRQEDLASAILRIVEKKPLVQAKDLLALGVVPGPKMGVLLKEAERIAVNRRLETRESVLKALRLLESPLRE